MSKRILNKNNFNSDGTLNFKSLTIGQCFELYRDRINNFLTDDVWREHYSLTWQQVTVIKRIHDYIDNQLNQPE